MRRNCIRLTTSIMKGSVVNSNKNNDKLLNQENNTKDKDIMEQPSSNDTEDDQMIDDTTAVPVGITIAYRHQHKGVLDEKMLRATVSDDVGSSRKAQKKSGTPSKKHSSKKKVDEQERINKKGGSSFQVFLESAAIYFLCLILPTALGYLYNWYDIWRYERETGERVHEQDGSYIYEYLLNYQWFVSSVYDPVEAYMCDDGGSDASYAWALVSSMAARTGLCPESDLNSMDQKRSVLSDDVSARNDVVTIAVCSCLLAVIRIAIVQYTVPMEDADKVEAMVRVKSDHFLRSNYMLSPSGTPLQKMTVRNISSDMARASLQLPNLNDPGPHEIPEDDMFGFHIDATEREEDPAMVSARSLKTSIKSDKIPTGPRPSDNPSVVNNGNKKRLYAAPRYATALFRLLYSTVTAAIALIYFRDANFWPWYVMGHGSTVKCWDLSGGMSVGMDSDFDQHNAVLKRFFLWQASYHWHSGAFHILSLLILLLHPTKHAPRRFLSFQTSSTAYVRSLTQHVASVALIAVAYNFSSLRRLVAIGMFAFDVSSWFLHLLQVCINAPEDSRWRRREIVSRVYWYLVIPSFVVARFMIWPAIWYSAAFESSFWLKQLEKTLWPGSAALLRNTIHFFMGILLSFSAVYFRRLLSHPQIQALLQ